MAIPIKLSESFLTNIGISTEMHNVNSFRTIDFNDKHISGNK